MTEQAEERTIEIKHHRVRDYRTEFVNGVAGAGPLQDGFYRVTFFRDALPLITEVFGVRDDNPLEIDVKKQKPIATRIVREDLMTVIASAETLRAMGRSMIAMADASSPKKD